MRSATASFLRQYFRPAADSVTVEETSYTRDGERLEASVFRPTRRAPGGAWIVLHGLTFTGRQHRSLQRFAQAMAAAGHVVFVPDIPEWRRLEVAPVPTLATIRAAVRTLAQRDDIDRDRIGLIGFSFGATQALVAATDPDVENRVRGIVAWGGYLDVQRLFQFGLTGEHEWGGRRYRTDPDPYGRWIMGANYLTAVPGYKSAQQTSQALWQLARTAGQLGKFAGDPSFNPLKEELARELPREQRHVFRLFAASTPLSDVEMTEARELAARLADAGVRTEPLLDPRPHIGRLRVRTFIAHGRDDRLVPFTESLRAGRELPRDILTGCTITGLFAHSGGTQPELGPMRLARETGVFLSILRRILTFV